MFKNIKRNVGVLDRIVRVGLGLLLLPAGLLLLGGLQGSVVGLVTTAIGAIGLLTGLTGYCILYTVFGINTLEKEQELMTRCMSKGMSMIAEFRQAPASNGNPGVVQNCGPCQSQGQEINSHQG